MTVTIAPATELDAVFVAVNSHADTSHVAVITDRAGTSPTPGSPPRRPDTPRRSRS